MPLTAARSRNEALKTAPGLPKRWSRRCPKTIPTPGMLRSPSQGSLSVMARSPKYLGLEMAVSFRFYSI